MAAPRICLTLRRGDERVWIPLSQQIIVDPAWWDPEGENLLPSCKLSQSTSSLNMYLAGQKTDLQRRLLRMDDLGELRNLSLSQVELRLKHKPATLSVGEFTQGVVKELEKHKREGNARAYDQVKILFRHYADKPLDQVRFNEIDKPFLHRHLDHLRDPISLSSKEYPLF